MANYWKGNDRCVTKADVESLVRSLSAPAIGDIKWIAHDLDIPTGWLLCDGSEVGRADYADLFAVIGVLWGSGDGSTTFNLPNLIDKTVWGGSDAGGYKEAGLPDIEGKIDSHNGALTALDSGAFYFISNKTQTLVANYSNPHPGTLGFAASRSDSIYGASDTVQPPAAILKPIIRASVASSAPAPGSTVLSESEVKALIAQSAATNKLGEVKWMATNVVVGGWLLCDGSAVSRTEFADLFGAIGTVWGEGDGSTTFNLPNLIDKTVWGGGVVGSYKEAGLPNITGDNVRIDAYIADRATPTGAFAFGRVSAQGRSTSTTSSVDSVIQFDASLGTTNTDGTYMTQDESPYGKSNTVQPPAAVLKPYIRAVLEASDDPTGKPVTEAEIISLIRSYANPNPVGTYITSAATYLEGYLLCDGHSEPRASYPELAAILDPDGTAGDTFVLPDFTDRVMWGAGGTRLSTVANADGTYDTITVTPGMELEAGLPNITGTFQNIATLATAVSGAFGFTRNANSDIAITVGNAQYERGIFSLNASLANAIYGNSTTVQPPAIAVNVFIKY